MDNDLDLVPVEYVTSTGEPFQIQDILEVLATYPTFRVRVSALTHKVDILYGTSEGDVNRIVAVPARNEIVLCSDFGNWED